MARLLIARTVLALTASLLLTHEALAQFGGGKFGGGGRGRRAEAGTKGEQRPALPENSQEQIDYRLTAVEDIAASAKVLYDTLSPDHKTTADARLVTTLPNSYAGTPPSAMYRR